MYVAPLTFNWTPSPNITGQILQLTTNSVVAPPIPVSATQSSYVVPQIKQGDVLHFSVIEEGTFDNAPATTLDFGPVPDLTPPASAGPITAVIGTPVLIPDATTTTTLPPGS